MPPAMSPSELMRKIGIGGVGAHRAAAAVQDDRVEDVRQRLDRVRVRAQASRRLRVAGGDHVVRRGQRAERIEARRAADGLDRLGEDVVGQRVVGDRVGRGGVERAVARRAPQPAGRWPSAGRRAGRRRRPRRSPHCRKCSCDWNQSTSWSHWLLTFIHSAITVPLNFAARRGTAHDDARAVRVAGAQDRGRVGAGDRVAGGLTRRSSTPPRRSPPSRGPRRRPGTGSRARGHRPATCARPGR